MASSSNIDNDYDGWIEMSVSQKTQLRIQLEEHLGQDFVYLPENRADRSKGQLLSFRHLPSAIDFLVVFGGTFEMGFTEEEAKAVARFNTDIEEEFIGVENMRPVHRAHVSTFLMAQHPITLAVAKRYVALERELVHSVDGNIAWNYPARMTREKALELLAKIEFDLPSEAQWEYACRGNTRTPFYFGDSIPSEDVLAATILLNDFGDQERNRAAINPFGLIGLSVGEWCADSFMPNYVDAPETDHPIKGGPPYVVRGGGAYLWPWQGGCAEWQLCLSAYRIPSNSFQVFDLPPTWAVRPTKRLNISLMELYFGKVSSQP
jgi:formylglycine-generating enzyme required for sulfatase activity